MSSTSTPKPASPASRRTSRSLFKHFHYVESPDDTEEEIHRLDLTEDNTAALGLNHAELDDRRIALRQHAARIVVADPTFMSLTFRRDRTCSSRFALEVTRCTGEKRQQSLRKRLAELAEQREEKRRQAEARRLAKRSGVPVATPDDDHASDVVAVHDSQLRDHCERAGGGDELRALSRGKGGRQKRRGGGVGDVHGGSSPSEGERTEVRGPDVDALPACPMPMGVVFANGGGQLTLDAATPGALRERGGGDQGAGGELRAGRRVCLHERAPVAFETRPG